MSTAGLTEQDLRQHFGVPASTKLGVNDVGWLRVFAQPQVKQALETDGLFTISAKDLKAVSGREPRLMAKHDWSDSRPWPFKHFGLSILPLSRDRYVVGSFDLYQEFEAIQSPVRTVAIPPGIESLDFSHLTSEANALNAASITGMFERFLGCGPLHATVSGRMSSRRIPLSIGGHELEVVNAQMEIDGGFESPELLCVVEAKNSLNADFNIRQLFFPWARFNAQLSKPVVPVYQVYSNGVFYLYRYAFVRPTDPRSIHLVDSARYALAPSLIDVPLLRQLLHSTTPGPEPTVPFPQADSFDRVINLCELVADQPLTVEQIFEHYGFDPRQAQYYSRAAAYLGWMDTPRGKAIGLTQQGQAMIDAPGRHERNLAIIKALLSRQVFHAVIARALELGHVPHRDEIVGIMGRYNLGLSPVTAARRSSTVYHWCSWVWELATQPELAV